MDVLWLTGEYFEPQSQGMYQYSAALAESLTARDLELHFIGRERTDLAAEAAVPSNWTLLPAKQRGDLRRVLSRWPTKIGDIWGKDYRQAVQDALRHEPKVVVIDHMRAAGALPTLPRELPFVYVSHNDEYAVKRLAVKSKTRPHETAAFAADAMKHRVYEDWLIRRAALVSAITPEDADALGRRSGRRDVVYAPPRWRGPRVEERTITASTPREVLLMGSLGWEEKRRNLAELLHAIAERRDDDRLAITVTGGGYSAGDLETQFPEVEFHDYVDDLATLKERARLGVIYEPVGGGFKMKALDYVFSRIPLVVRRGSAVGLGLSPGTDYLEADELDELAELVHDVIDDIDRLNDLQLRAYAAADDTFGGEGGQRDFVEGVLGFVAAR